MARIRNRVAMFAMVLTLIALVASCASTRKAPEPAYEPPPEQALEPDSSEDIPEPEPVETEKFFIHTVKWTGECLSIIALWYTGKLENWKLLVLANPELNPKLIHLGDEIRIPESLMIKTETLTFDFVAKYVPSLQKRRTGDSPPAPAPAPKGSFGDVGETAPAAGESVPEADEISLSVDEAEQAGMDRSKESGASDTRTEEKQREEERPKLFGPKSFD